MSREVVIHPRQGGKTTRMLQWMREAPEGEHRVLVCPTGQEAMRLLRENPDLESWQFVSLDEVKDRDRSAWSGVLYGRGGHIVLGLDNLDLMLSGLILWPVGAFSVTGDELVRSPESEPMKGHIPVICCLPHARERVAAPAEPLDVERLAARLLEGQKRQGGSVLLADENEARAYAAWLLGASDEEATQYARLRSSESDR